VYVRTRLHSSVGVAAADQCSSVSTVNSRWFSAATVFFAVDCPSQLMFAIVFLGYTISFYIAFGLDVAGFRNIPTTILTLIRFLMG
jgi:hypothetical protein